MYSPREPSCKIIEKFIKGFPRYRWERMDITTTKYLDDLRLCSEEGLSRHLSVWAGC
jgi:hypothetical protein